MNLNEFREDFEQYKYGTSNKSAYIDKKRKYVKIKNGKVTKEVHGKYCDAYGCSDDYLFILFYKEKKIAEKVGCNDTLVFYVFVDMINKKLRRKNKNKKNDNDHYATIYEGIKGEVDAR